VQKNLVEKNSSLESEWDIEHFVIRANLQRHWSRKMQYF